MATTTALMAAVGVWSYLLVMRLILGNQIYFLLAKKGGYITKTEFKTEVLGTIIISFRNGKSAPSISCGIINLELF